MRLMKSNIERDGTGTVVLLPEEPEDMVRSIWSLLHGGGLSRPQHELHSIFHLCFLAYLYQLDLTKALVARIQPHRPNRHPQSLRNPSRNHRVGHRVNIQHKSTH